MDLFMEILISALIVIGGIFGAIGSYGLVKLPDPMTRLHAPTKAATVGVGSILIASMLWFGWFGPQDSWHELLIILFIFLTSPVTGLMIAKSHIHRSWQWQELPAPAPDAYWATCAPDREEPAAGQAKPMG